MTNTKESGDLAERLAADFLEGYGLNIIERNFRTRYGEIDLIANDSGMVVIIEVRAKKNEFSGLPIETVNYKKQQKVLKMARWYLAQNKLTDRAARIDVVGVTLTRPPKFEWIKNAVEER